MTERVHPVTGKPIPYGSTRPLLPLLPSGPVDGFKPFSSRRTMQIATTRTEYIDRNVVFDRDDGICGICNKPVDPANWDMDHVIALSNNGTHTYDNVQVSHPSCNRYKARSERKPVHNPPPTAWERAQAELKDSNL